MSPSPKVAIVILNWNGQKYLEQFLPFVLATSYTNYEVIVADNGSTDNSVNFLQQQYPGIRTICFKENYGFAKGYNEALKQVQSDYYVILNSDVEVKPDWLAPMVELLENNRNIAACQPKIHSYHNKTMFEYAGAAGGWLDKYGTRLPKEEFLIYVKKIKGNTISVNPYGAADADLTLRLMKPLQAEIDEKNQTKILDVEMPLIPVLSAMEQAGIGVDLPFFRQMSQELDVRLRQLEARILENRRGAV